MKQSTILVTGGSGFIGHHLVKFLSSRGHIVFNADIASTNPDERIDVRRFEDLKRLFESVKPDVVVHLAAVASVPICENDVDLCFETNVRGTLNVARLCSIFGCKVVFASSSAVYGNPSKLPTPVSYPVNPVNFYGLTKALGEQIVRYYVPSSHVIFRIFNVYGPECYRSYVIPDIIRKMLSGSNPITLLGTGEESRDFIYVDDVLEAFRIAIETRVAGTFNLGSGKTYKIRDVALMIRDIVATITNKRSIQSISFVFEGKMRRGDFMINWADISENNKIPGWNPHIDIKTGLRMTVEWFLKNA